MELLAAIDEDITIRTLRKDLEDLQKAPHNVVFANNLYRGKERLYRYKDCSFSLYSQTDAMKGKIDHFLSELDAFAGIPQYDWMRLFFIELSNGMLEGRENIVSFDNNKELHGLENLIPLAKAIIHKQPLKITYKPFSSEAKEEKVHPYHLRQFNNRWFLFGLNEEYKKIFNYPLDRIVSISELCKEYINTDINFEDFFEDIVGVSITDTPIETIELKVKSDRYPYIETKPLHSTQTEHKALASEDYRYISIKVRVNNELVTKIASFGPDLEVISPESVRNTIKDKVMEMYHLYNNK